MPMREAKDPPAGERPVRFGEERRLFGVLTDPDDTRPGGSRPGVVLLNAGRIHRVGPGRLHVGLARRLADRGFPVLRVDQSGRGESLPVSGRSRKEAARRDARAAVERMVGLEDVDSVLLFGICSGARDALRAARADGRVRGAFMVDGYAYRTPRFWVRHYGRRLFRLESWKNVLRGRNAAGRWLHSLVPRPGGGATDGEAESARGLEESGRGLEGDDSGLVSADREEVRSALSELADRGVRLHFLYTGAWTQYVNHERQLREAFPSVDPGEAVEVEYRPEYDHTFSSMTHREALLNTLEGWAARC